MSQNHRAQGIRGVKKLGTIGGHIHVGALVQTPTAFNGNGRAYQRSATASRLCLSLHLALGRQVDAWPPLSGWAPT